MKIICIGRNYIDHAKELNNKVPTKPLIFMKPPSALNRINNVTYPSFTEDMHYELELCLLISKTGKSIPEAEAGSYFYKIGLGLDYTARDLQRKCKVKGHPWEVAKAFDGSASLSSFYDKSKYNLDNIKFKLNVNGKP